MLNVKLCGDDLTICLTGRIDSVNAASVEKEIDEILSSHPSTRLTLDCEGLEYISSAGLRIILRLRKTDSGLKVINTSPEVYDIFDMTGFTEMIDVRKAYRSVSVDGCEVIGEGANGKVYRIGPDTIVKVYSGSESLEDIQRERERARKAFVKGIPTAISYDVVKVGDCFGSVFELLNAESFARILAADPGRVDEIAALSAGLLRKIHAIELTPGELPDARQITLKRMETIEAYLPVEVFDRLKKLVMDIPADNHMIHGDFHLKNIMLQDGEAMLIDMDTLALGNPVFELGAMFNSFLGYSQVYRNNVLEFLGVPYETAERFWNRVLRDYLGTQDEDVIDTVTRKAMIVGFIRVLYHFIRHGGMEEERSRLEIANCQKCFARLLPGVDSLAL